MTSASLNRLIDVTNLRHRYQTTDVINIDRWSLSRGQHTLILGASGSGKTTLLSILTGLLKPTAGQISLFNTTVNTKTNREIEQLRAQNIGLIFQDNHLISSLTVDQNIQISSHIARQKHIEKHKDKHPDDWHDYLLNQLNLAHVRHKKPQALSRGEAQRAAIICALIARPKLVIADEPTSALDDDHAEKTLNVLQDLTTEAQATLLIATHDSRLKHAFHHHLTLSPQIHKGALK